MLSTYSPQREGSGMMQLHSPPHDHKAQYDPHSAISEIRRSLSRSPSKPYNFRSPPIGSGFIYTPSPLSPPRRTASEQVLHFNSISSPHITRSTQTGRIQRPVLRRTVQTTSGIRIRTSPKSPSKRTMIDFNDHPPQPQSLRKRRSTELEEDDMDVMDSEDKENFFKHSDDQINSWKTTQARQEKSRSGGFLCEITPLSPMKRPDSVTNMDHTPTGSPSAKRRSVQVSSAMDFSIFESDNLRDDSQEKRSRDDHDWFRSIPMSPSTRFSTIPKRSSSLRKSTLQQRQSDKSSPLRLNNFAELRQNWLDNTPMAKKSSRTSLDVNLLSQPRDSPFSSPGFLLNASIHPVQSSQNTTEQDLQSRHPLSNAIAPPSSGTASVQDDSPTHEPVRRLDKPRSHDFSKSLPIGAMRPPQMPHTDSQEFSSQGSFATPAAYKAAKPLPAAFMSTGLISKKNRNIDEPDAGLPKAHMPDTPCKKQSTTFAQVNDKFKPTNATIHNLRASFGTPKSPSEVPFGVTRATPFPWARSTSIFSNRAKQSLARKASFASIVSLETEEKPSSQSPSAQVESQSTDGGYPPTPTKHNTLVEARAASVSPSPQHIMSKPFAPSSIQVSKFVNSKLFNSESVRFTHANTNRLTVSPHANEVPYSSPHTPLESVFPPDPSSLSISGRGDRPTTRHSNDQFSGFPATPTGPREYFNNFSNRPSLNLGAPDVADVDASLTSRFDKVDLVGTGEFSQVYRVSEPPEASPFQKAFSSSRPASRNSLPGKVWAVKKSRHPYSGPKDRARKVHEVDILKTLGHNDHVINFVDSWEDRGHLYIQTEFCEEGTLDVFLAQSGSRARLDDFRIWKILLELSLVSRPLRCLRNHTNRNIGNQTYP